MSLPPNDIDWSRHALFLDFDGTLAPIAPRPGDVTLTDLATAILIRARIATGGALAILSGRALLDLQEHVPGHLPVLSGSHGAEFHGIGAEAGPAGAARLDPARTRVVAYAETHSLLSEKKPGSVSLHYRARPELGEAVRALITTLAEAYGLRAIHGHMVSEIALPDVSKGTALTRIMAEPPFAGRVPVMIGDDVTDEDGFHAANVLGGYGIRIGEVATAARYTFPDLAAMQEWLGLRLGLDPASMPKN